jgi:hypothetical protein
MDAGETVWSDIKRHPSDALLHVEPDNIPVAVDF